ncbi:MAG: tRNA-queuosine alpha-mannosyltransferase domain-containing protein [Phycisphaerae bacterium]
MTSTLRILALEPYYGGSHRSFLNGWSRRSRHEWTVLTLPARKWKWRMRHASLTFARQAAELMEQGSRWDVIFCSDMLELAAFRGMAPADLRATPAVLYFHENQLTYPVQYEDQRDLHFGLSNMNSALAAEAVWFNSEYHRREFLSALGRTLKTMPDFVPTEAVGLIDAKSTVQPPGVEEFPRRAQRSPGPLRIAWAARWEHDKRPGDFFEAMAYPAGRGVDFRLSVLGEQFREYPKVFDRARERFADRIDHWGHQPRQEYRRALASADVFVSTAGHEFFGIAAVEAMAAGTFPLLPHRLSYPELLEGADDKDDFFYDGTPDGLAERIEELAQRLNKGELWRGDADRARRAVARYCWAVRAGELDSAISNA